MTLTELRYVVAVARERHFGRAAESCHVSQPTLSVAIRKLEDELGVTLFERGPGELKVTPVGQEIVVQAQRVLEEAARVKELAAAGRDPLAGTLRLGAIYTIGPYLLPKLIPILRRAAPAMQLFIRESFTHALSQLLRQGELDVIVVALPFEAPGCVVQPVYDEPFLVAVPPGHPWERKKNVTADELNRESLLLLGEGHCLRDQVLEFCGSGARSRALEGGSLETIRQMVASGVGITVLPSSSIAAGGGATELVRILPFAKPVPQRRVAIAWRKSFPRPQALEALRQATLACELPQVVKLPRG